MATPTSSSNRSKRKASKPVTADKGRVNRARVSTAKTTSSDTRATNSGARITNASQRAATGSSKVSGSTRPALPARSSASDLQRLQTAARTKPTRPAPKINAKPKSTAKLPPGQKGGPLVSTGTRQSRAQAKANAAAQGSTGPNRIGRSDARPALPPGRTGGALARTSSGSLTRLSNTASSAAKNLSKAGRALTGLKGGLAGTALAMGGSAAIDAATNAYKQAIRKERGQRAAESGQSGRYVPGGQQSRGGMGGVGNIPPGEGPRNNPNFGKPAAKPPARPSASRPSQSTPSTRTASGSGTQRSTASRPSPTSTPRTAGTATTVSRPQQTRPAEKQPSMGREVFDRSGKGTLGPNYGIDQFGDKNGIDMERRRAFLDAKDSQEGRKAINKLMEERRKKQRENDSTSK